MKVKLYLLNDLQVSIDLARSAEQNVDRSTLKG